MKSSHPNDGCAAFCAVLRRIATLSVVAIAIVAMSSCRAYKKIPYFPELENDSIYVQNADMEPKIAYKDQFTIIVTTPTPEASKAFNLFVTPNAMVGTSVATHASNIQTYEVNREGYIEFPVLGMLHVAGMTREQLQDSIKKMLYPSYLTEEPIVTVRRTNFTVTVMGEVVHPGRQTISGDRVSVLDALAMAGDMTLYGKRDNVLVVREDDMGNKTTTRLNLQKKETFDSPYFYLKQNDMIYVTPNKSRGNVSAITSSETIVFSVVSTLATLTYLILNLADRR